MSDLLKKEIYRKGFYDYGYITLVYLIDAFCEEESYEECALILKVLREEGEKLKEDIPTYYTDESIDKYASSVLVLGGSLSREEVKKKVSNNGLKLINKINAIRNKKKNNSNKSPSTKL